MKSPHAFENVHACLLPTGFVFVGMMSTRKFAKQAQMQQFAEFVELNSNAVGEFIFMNECANRS